MTRKASVCKLCSCQAYACSASAAGVGLLRPTASRHAATQLGPLAVFHRKGPRLESRESIQPGGANMVNDESDKAGWEKQMATPCNAGAAGCEGRGSFTLSGKGPILIKGGRGAPVSKGPAMHLSVVLRQYMGIATLCRRQLVHWEVAHQAACLPGRVKPRPTSKGQEMALDCS